MKWGIPSLSTIGEIAIDSAVTPETIAAGESRSCFWTTETACDGSPALSCASSLNWLQSTPWAAQASSRPISNPLK